MKQRTASGTEGAGIGSRYMLCPGWCALLVHSWCSATRRRCTRRIAAGGGGAAALARCRSAAERGGWSKTAAVTPSRPGSLGVGAHVGEKHRRRQQSTIRQLQRHCALETLHTLRFQTKRFLAHSSPVQRSCGSLARHAGKFVRTFCRARVIYAIEVVLTTQVADRQYVYTGRCFRHRVASDSEQGTHNLRSVLLTSCLSSNAADQIKSNRAKQGRAMLRRARILLGGAHRAVVNLGVALAGAPLGAHVRAAWHVNRVSLVTRRRVC